MSTLTYFKKADLHKSEEEKCSGEACFLRCHSIIVNYFSSLYYMNVTTVIYYLWRPENKEL